MYVLISCVFTSEERHHIFVHGDGRHGAVLSYGELQQEGGYADEQQHEHIGDQERAAAELVAQVREPPHIAQA